MGNPFGRPDDRAAQTSVLRAALNLVAECNEAGTLVDYDTDWGKPFAFTVKEKPADYQLKK